mmetsp:Transcript_59068/g.162000  ORF Transcript_59068/g.162000 Transcript_59068/m.162000 type:complete len:457 (+) Transcript_59068:1771-3141(+)
MSAYVRWSVSSASSSRGRSSRSRQSALKRTRVSLERSQSRATRAQSDASGIEPYSSMHSNRPEMASLTGMKLVTSKAAFTSGVVVSAVESAKRRGQRSLKPLVCSPCSILRKWCGSSSRNSEKGAIAAPVSARRICSTPSMSACISNRSVLCSSRSSLERVCESKSTTRLASSVGSTSSSAALPLALEKPCRTSSVISCSALWRSSASVASRSLASGGKTSADGSSSDASSAASISRASGKGSPSSSSGRSAAAGAGASGTGSASNSPVSRRKVNSIGSNGLAARTAAPTSPGRTALPLISTSLSPILMRPHSAEGVPSPRAETQLSSEKPMPRPPCAGRSSETTTRSVLAAPRSVGAAGGSTGFMSGSSERASTERWRPRPSISSGLDDIAALEKWRLNVSPMTEKRLGPACDGSLGLEGVGGALPGLRRPREICDMSSLTIECGVWAKRPRTSF